MVVLLGREQPEVEIVYSPFHIPGKSDEYRAVPFGANTGRALSR